jgi:hypothetical protein
MNTKKWSPDEISAEVKSLFIQEFGKGCDIKEEEEIVSTAIFKYDYGINTEDTHFDIFLSILECFFNIDLQFTKKELADLTVQKLSDAINERINVPSIVEKVH